MRWVMLHGLGQTPESWKTVVQTAGLKTEACCPNLADWLGGGDYSGLYQGLEEYCDRMDAPFFLCGLSLGGVLALQYAAEHPDRVAALALIGAQYVMPKRLLKVQNLLFSLLPERMFRETGMGKEKMIALTGSMMGLDFTEDLDRIRCPALVLCGERDRANRAAAQALGTRLPLGELSFVKGAGHEVNVDAPEALAAKLKKFLDSRSLT